jgi:Tol biopolymer transport system component
VDQITNKAIFVHDRVTGNTEHVTVSSDGSKANRGSGGTSMSGDGRFVAFWSDADNLFPGDNNGTWNILVRDRTLGVTEHVSVSSGGVPGNGNHDHPTISSDGRFVTFESHSTNLVSGGGPIMSYTFDRQTGQTEIVSVDIDGNYANGFTLVMSSDGRYVVFYGHNFFLKSARSMFQGYSDATVQQVRPSWW